MLQSILAWLFPVRQPSEDELIDKYADGFVQGYLIAHQGDYHGLEEGTAAEKIGHMMAWRQARRKEAVALFSLKGFSRGEV